MQSEINTQPEVYKVQVEYFDALLEAIAELNKKADKLGVPHAVLTVHGQETVTKKCDLTDLTYTVTYNLVSVTGDAPKLAGWTLVAVIEQQASGENLVSCVPGQTCPPEYRGTDNRCDHCGHFRRRKEVFVLRHDDGRHCQVGRQCLADFLGGKSPEGILAWAAYCLGVLKTVADSTDEFWGGGGGGEIGYNMERFLATTAIVIRRMGWVSRTAAIEAGQYGDGPTATVSTVLYLLTPPRTLDAKRDMKLFIAKHNLVAEARDSELAAAALAWGKALPTDQGDYLYNLGVACRLDFVRYKTAGLMASLIAAYQRHLDREAELNMKRAENAGKVRGLVGEVGKRQGFAGLTVKSLRYFESMYGSKTLVRLEDATGNILIWWATGNCDWLEEGQTIDITGTVKEHGDYKGTPQTILSRVAEGLPKVKGKRTKTPA